MSLTEQIVRLAKLKDSPAPVVSAYLNTRWADEHQRDRTRVLLKRELRRAREGASAEDLTRALDWVETQAERLISQAAHPDAHGVALFASPALGLREVIAIRMPFEDTFVVSNGPFLGPLAAILDETPPALVAFVNAESARLIPVSIAGAGEDVRLDSEVPGHHRRGGWAQLAQSRYQRYIEERRGRHFEAVVEALSRLVDEHGVERIVLARSADTVAAFRRALPARIDAQVAGSVPGSRHEPASQLVARAVDEIERVIAREAAAAADTVLTAAAKGGQAVAGLEEVLDALQRGAVERLYLLRGFTQRGRACPSCAALQPGDAATCRVCGHATEVVELGEALVARTIAAGGSVTTVDAHPGLARVGGVSARLRFAL
jgi:peptide chain release factor subunit 1